ncbi:MAG TPA: DEAD/DEAH box helicase family protein [Methylococcus sp.]|nr:DEAD/DEAH box helicase family protein [Methylococcus sp.]
MTDQHHQTPEIQARKTIDTLLARAGWQAVDVDQANIHATRGVAIREFPLRSGYGFADYLLYVDGKAAGIVEAKKEGITLSGVERQAERYTLGLPEGLPAWRKPLPFAYQSTGIETRFTNGLDAEPRSRGVFAFHRPETLAAWLEDCDATAVGVKEPPGDYRTRGQTFLARLQSMPALKEEGLWPAQIQAIQNLEQSLKENRPRALIQMATGSGKTFTAISFIYRLIKFAGTRRVLFLVDRGNLGDQTLKEFQQYASPYNNFKFTEEYIVQRLYSMLKGKDLPEDLEEVSVGAALAAINARPEPIEYNPSIPIESFDIIVTDECHRSIYNLWEQVLEYFDAYLIGLTATPSKQTFGFFNQNLVMEYNHEMAVADGVNVNYDVYRIRTQITEAGSRVEAGYSVQIQERDTRKKRWEELDDDFSYDPNQLDRDVVAPDQIRTIIRAFRDKLFTEIFPGREWVSKTLIFAKDDAHAENIVEIVREEIRQGQRLRPEDHLPHHRRQAQRPHQRVPHQPHAAHRRHGGHDRHRHRHQGGGSRHVHARRQIPRLLRADERPRRARRQTRRSAKRHPRRQGQGPLRHRRRRRRLRAGQNRLPPHGAKAHRQLRKAHASRRLRQHRRRRAHLPRRAAGEDGTPHQRRRRRQNPRRQRRPGPERPRPPTRRLPKPRPRISPLSLGERGRG